LRQLCERWIYSTCLCFALDLEEQEKSRFQYQYSEDLAMMTRPHREALILDHMRTIPFFRRRDIEALFGLKKRQAVNLMHRIGAVRVSSELAVAQRDLVRWLEEPRSTGAPRREGQERDGGKGGSGGCIA